MSRQTFPTWVDQPGSCFSVFQVTGADVSTGAQSSAGLDGRGQQFCTIARSGANYTVEFLVSYAEPPYVYFMVDDDNVAVTNLDRFDSFMTFSLAERDDNTAPVDTAVFTVLVLHFDRTNFVS